MCSRAFGADRKAELSGKGIKEKPFDMFRHVFRYFHHLELKKNASIGLNLLEFVRSILLACLQRSPCAKEEIRM